MLGVFRGFHHFSIHLARIPRVPGLIQSCWTIIYALSKVVAVLLCKLLLMLWSHRDAVSMWYTWPLLVYFAYATDVRLFWFLFTRRLVRIHNLWAMMGALTYRGWRGVFIAIFFNIIVVVILGLTGLAKWYVPIYAWRLIFFYLRFLKILLLYICVR